MKHRCNLTLSPFYTYTNNKVKLRGKKRNLFLSPLIENILQPLLRIFERTEVDLLYAKLSQTLAKWEAEYSRRLLRGNWAIQSENWPTDRKITSKSVKRTKKWDFFEKFSRAQIFLSFNIQDAYNQLYTPTASDCSVRRKSLSVRCSISNCYALWRV